MEKIADGYYRFTEMKYPSGGVHMKFTVEKFYGEELDTEVELRGQFAVSGSTRKEFAERLGILIDEYRI